LFKKYFVTSLLFLAGLVIGFSAISYVNTTFRIQHVEVFGGTTVEHKTLSTILKNLSTLTTQVSEIRQIVTARFPTMRITRSEIRYPNTLILTIENEKPLAFLRTDYGYLSLSKGGTVLKKERTTDTPHPFISFYQTIHHGEYQVGQRIRFAAIERALLFVSLLADEGYQTETVAIDSVDMIACKTKGFEVAFSQSRGIDLQSHELRQIIRQLKVGALKVERLDLRFDKPVVQFPKK